MGAIPKRCMITEMFMPGLSVLGTQPCRRQAA